MVQQLNVAKASQAAEPIGGSAAWSAVLERIKRFARDDTATILLQGESGTGKTMMARLAHSLSPRANGPFQHVILSALEDGVSGSELFGHVAGAFTDARRPRAGHFASAAGGTVFLDEIAKPSLAIQGKLLNVLERHEMHPVGSDRGVRVDVRIIAAANEDLDDLAARGRFLPDLRSRLATFRVRLPSLRERRADIPGLVQECIQRHAKAAGYSGGAPEVDEALMQALRFSDWPDNIRELDGVIHRLLLEADGAARLTLGHCRADLAYVTGARQRPYVVTQAEITEALGRTKSKAAAARLLGIDRKTLRVMLERHGTDEGLKSGVPRPAEDS